jgi:hypothetical protein
MMDRDQAERIAKALESIADSLAKLAHPRFVVDHKGSVALMQEDLWRAQAGYEFNHAAGGMSFVDSAVLGGLRESGAA